MTLTPVRTGSCESVHVSLEIANQLIPPPEAIGFRAVVGKPGQDTHEVGRVERERIPALGQPGFADPAPLEHDVLAAILLQEIADAEARLARAHDDRIVRRHVICSLEDGVLRRLRYPTTLNISRRPESTRGTNFLW